MYLPKLLFRTVLFCFPYFPCFYILFCFILFFCYQTQVRTPTSLRKPMPSALNQILNQPSPSPSPDVLAMAAAAAAVAQAKTELKKDVRICLFFIKIILQAFYFKGFPLIFLFSSYYYFLFLKELLMENISVQNFVHILEEFGVHMFFLIKKVELCHRYFSLVETRQAL